MSDSADYGMFSDEGNERVEEILEATIAASRRFDLREIFEAVCQKLSKLADDEPSFDEAGDTVVRDAVYEELRLRDPNRPARGTTPEAALAKIVKATKQIEAAKQNLLDAKVILKEQTNGSTVSGLPDVLAALDSLVGDDPEAELVLGHLYAILALNGAASQAW